MKNDQLLMNLMTIEIDDAGTGDLIGDAFILIWRRERNDLIIKNIPLEIYQSSDFNILSKNHTKEVLIEALNKLGVSKQEEIYMCTGNIFDEARVYLRENQYNLIDSKIEGYLQDKVEDTYLNHIIEEYGVPDKLLTRESGKNRFFKLFNWIGKDFPRREVYVKTGFEKWDSKWKIQAKENWMKAMVNTGDNGSNSDENGKETQKSSRKFTKPYKKNYKKASFHSKSRKSTKAKSRGYSGKGKSRGPNRNEKKYSSTDPDRKRFFT
jgi:hypothetical protein